MARAFLSNLHQKTVLWRSKHSSGLSSSTFMKTGQLTMDEFVAAGDYLVENYSTWQWVAGEASKRRDGLPDDKQYLQFRDAPCLPHPSLDGGATGGERQVEDDEDGGWVEAGVGAFDDDDDDDDEAAAAAEADMDGGGAPAPASALAAGGGAAGGGGEAEDEDDDSDDDVPDLDDVDADFDGIAVVDDDPSSAAAPAGGAAAAVSEDTVMQTRTYDLSITYDGHYNTPRVFLFGYDASKAPLKASEWKTDFSQEHLDKTVTYESHPHEGYSCPTIHPCKHASAMLKMIELTVGDSGKTLDVVGYMVIFLKFIQSIIPNIEYDYTSQFEISSSGGAEAGSG